jgi:transcriptional regulator of acetoin/glycerol metabolism
VVDTGVMLDTIISSVGGLVTSNTVTVNDSILTINDYVKMMVLKFQTKYPDTELSKKLGISRKSLWEKRKKFGIEKTKK